MEKEKQGEEIPRYLLDLAFELRRMMKDKKMLLTMIAAMDTVDPNWKEFVVKMLEIE